jgi:hypothetical protein
MEKIKIGTYRYDIASIDQRGNQLKITFPAPLTIKGDLSKIELYTAGGVYCTTFLGYTTIYNVSGPVVVLSKDKITSPDPDPDPVDPPGEPAVYNAREEIEAAKEQIAIANGMINALSDAMLLMSTPMM